MRKILLLLGIVGLMFVATGCDKKEYQHPAHRSGAVK